jgi:hypothetical protein
MMALAASAGGKAGLVPAGEASANAKADRSTFNWEPGDAQSYIGDATSDAGHPLSAAIDGVPGWRSTQALQLHAKTPRAMRSSSSATRRMPVKGGIRSSGF